MFISKFRVQNYKSYFDSGEVKLGSGINIITGQNHAGKTALLQALSLKFVNNIHRSTKTLPSPISKIDSVSSIEIDIDISKEEFEMYIFEHFDQFILKSNQGINPAIYNHRELFKHLKEYNTIRLTITENGQIIFSSFPNLGGLHANIQF